jgi:hypothetical protein
VRTFVAFFPHATQRGSHLPISSTYRHPVTFMSKLLFRDGMDEESDGKVTICSWIEAHFGSEAVMVSVAGVAYDAHSVVCLLICYLHDLRRKSLRKSSKAMTGSTSTTSPPCTWSTTTSASFCLSWWPSQMKTTSLPLLMRLLRRRR